MSDYDWPPKPQPVNALYPTDMGGYQPWQAGTSGSLSSYTPTLRDRIANALMGDQRPSPERNRLVEGLMGSRGTGTAGFGLLEAFPGGQLFSAQDAWRGGDDRALAMALMPGLKAGKMGVMTRDELASSITNKLREALDAGDGYRYGVRVTKDPLTPGEVAPPSKNWYPDFISDDHPYHGRAQYPDHGTDLAGPATVGIRSLEDIADALAVAGLTRLPDGAKNRFGKGIYGGDHISIIRSKEVVDGVDPGEWIMPNGEVVSSWKFPPTRKGEEYLNGSMP